jgi:hypothetical protein
MILDNNLSLGSFATGASLSAGTHDLPDVVDLRSNTNYVATASGSLYTIAQGTQTVDVGAGSDLLLIFTVTTAFAGGTNVAFQAVTDSTDNLDTTPLVCGEVGPIATASLTVGTQIVVRITPQQQLGGSLQRYLGANLVTTGTYTAGTVRGDIVLDIQDRRNYAGGFVVS